MRPIALCHPTVWAPGDRGVAAAPAGRPAARSTLPTLPAPGEMPQVGPEIRDLRRARQMTLPQLAAATGYSIGYLSQVERGLSSPSVRALHGIAQALGVTVGWFLRAPGDADATPGEAEFVVRAGQRRQLTFEAGIADELLSPHLHGAIELLMSRFPPGSGVPDAITHRGEEAGVVLTGQLELVIGDGTFLLEPGDSFAFPSTTPHRYRNPGVVETVVVWAITPPTY